MIEFFKEIGLIGTLKLCGILLLVAFVLNFNIIDSIIQSTKTKRKNDTYISKQVKLEFASKKYRRSESLEGSRLFQIGYDVEVSFNDGSKNHILKTAILFSQYDKQKALINNLLIKEGDSIWVKTNTEYNDIIVDLSKYQNTLN